MEEMTRAGELGDRLAALLGSWDYERSPAELVALGKPALRRLLDAVEGKGTLWREGVDPRDYEDALQAAVAAFGKSDIDSVLAEMRGRVWEDSLIVSSGLTRVADPRIAAMLVEEAASKSPLRRLEAVQSLGMQRDPRATEALVRALSARSADVRYAAVESLGEAGDPGAIEALQNFAKRNARTPWIAESARAAIAKIRKLQRSRGARRR
jgi:HEAT repeat protein